MAQLPLRKETKQFNEWIRAQTRYVCIRTVTSSRKATQDTVSLTRYLLKIKRPYFVEGQKVLQKRNGN